MSYINFTVLEKYGLAPLDFILLAAIKQTELEYLEKVLTDTHYSRFNELSLIKHIKQKRKDESALVSLRLNDKGLQIWDELNSAPTEPEDQQVFDWLSNHYKSAGKEIGNRKKTLNHIKDFRIKSGIQKNNLIKLCVDFLKENEERSNKLEYIFYYPKTVFTPRFDLEESWLYSFYLKKEDYFKSIFEEY